jgi:DNA polymerase III epsilon subunit-like protein
MLCAIDVETSGLIAGYHEILQLAAIPLGDDYKWNRHLNFYNKYLRPDCVDRVDPEAVKVLKRYDTSLDYDQVITSKTDLNKFCETGIEQSRAADMFIAWFEKLGLKPKRRLLPVGHNLQFDMSFIEHWLGKHAYDYIFDPRWRDTMTVSLFWNDVDGFRNDRCMFKDAKLGSLCTSLKVENFCAHNAFDDAIATAECYGRMVKQFDLRAVVPNEEDLVVDPNCIAAKRESRAVEKLIKQIPDSVKEIVIAEYLANNPHLRGNTVLVDEVVV